MEADNEETYILRSFERAKAKYRPQSLPQSSRPGTDLALPWWQNTAQSSSIYFCRSPRPSPPKSHKKRIKSDSPRQQNVVEPPTLRQMFESSRLNGRVARKNSVEVLENACNRWLAAMIASEYREREKLHQNMESIVASKRERLEDIIKTDIPKIEECLKCQQILLVKQQENLEKLRLEESELLSRAHTIEDRLAEASSHLVAPINHALDCIYNESMFKSTSDKSEVVFTAKCIESLIPKLPPRPAMIVYDPYAEEKAHKEAKARRDARRKKLADDVLFITTILI